MQPSAISARSTWLSRKIVGGRNRGRVKIGAKKDGTPFEYKAEGVGFEAKLHQIKQIYIITGLRMTAYLGALPEPLYALFGTGYLGYAVMRQWGKVKGSDR